RSCASTASILAGPTLGVRRDVNTCWRMRLRLVDGQQVRKRLHLDRERRHRKFEPHPGVVEGFKPLVQGAAQLGDNGWPLPLHARQDRQDELLFDERRVAPRSVIRLDRGWQLRLPEEALTFVQLLPNILRWFHRLATRHERVRERIVLPKLGGRLMRYATVEHSDDGHYGLDVLPVGGGDEPICARRPSPIRERHREDASEGLGPAHQRSTSTWTVPALPSSPCVTTASLMPSPVTSRARIPSTKTPLPSGTLAGRTSYVDSIRWMAMTGENRRTSRPKSTTSSLSPSRSARWIAAMSAFMRSARGSPATER